MLSERSSFIGTPSWRKYGAALFSVAVALLIRWALESWLPHKFGFLTIFGAIAFSVWYGRWKPAVFATIIGYLCVEFLFFAPGPGPLVDILAELGGYLFSCAIIIGFGEAMHLAKDRAEAESVRCRNAQEAEARQAELLSTTLASIGDGVISTDAQGTVTFLNPEAERLTGWKSAEAQGRLLPEIFRIVNEKTRHVVENPVDKVLRTGRVAALANHTVLISKSGIETPIDDSAAPIRHRDGSLAGVVLVFRDFSEHKAAEEKLRDAHKQLSSRAHHLEALVQERTARLNEMIGDLEAFSYSIVHDMRGPLRAMNSFTELLQEECGCVSPTAASYMQRIRGASVRMDRLIQDGLNYSRLMRAELPMVALDAAALVRGIMETYPSIQPPHAEIEIAGKIPLVNANEATLTQCVSNLLGNAVKFVAPGVQPKIRVWAETCGDRVRLCFKDNGIGIPIGAHERIFQIFQRLDNKYEGTGIGLAIVKKAAERMGGSVGVESEPGNGSTFWIELSAAATNEMNRNEPASEQHHSLRG